MQSKAAKLFFFAVVALVISTSRPSSAQQPGTAKQMQAPGPVYQDTQWSPDEDIQLLKSNLRSQKKQIVAANMDLSDAEAEKFWPVYDRYATDEAKVYDTKLPSFKNILRTTKQCLGIRLKVTCAGALRWNKT